MKKRILPLVGAVIVCFSGCQLQKQVDVKLTSQEDVSLDNENKELIEENESENELMGTVYAVLQEPACDLEDMSQLIFGISSEELEQYSDYHNLENTYQREDGWHFFWSNLSAEFYDAKYGLDTCYSGLVEKQIYTDPQAYRQLHPLEDLDTCSKEEAIAFCAPYAKVLGYEEAEVEVYAWTLDFLQDETLIVHSGAPDENWQFSTRQQVWDELEDSGMSEDEILIEYLTRQSELVRGDAPWEKKHEALCLIYRPYFNGLQMVSRSQYLLLIYVPYYEEIVYGRVIFPFQAGEVLGEYPLISKEKAISNAMVGTNSNSSTNFIVDDITLVYTMVYREPEIDDENADWRRLEPCWKIDYSKGTTKNTIFIDAIDGFICNNE